jgi:hypothetical protein
VIHVVLSDGDDLAGHDGREQPDVGQRDRRPIAGGPDRVAVENALPGIPAVLEADVAH